jgi:hypothetical protein
MTNALDGFYICKKDLFSRLTSPYRAEERVYDKCLTNIFERTKEKIITDMRTKDDDMFVFRIRTGNPQDATRNKTMYGKMILPFRLIDITYYLNPTPEDTNLEFDGENNF